VNIAWHIVRGIQGSENNGRALNLRPGGARVRPPEGGGTRGEFSVSELTERGKPEEDAVR
jgi:hypothetical protein